MESLDRASFVICVLLALTATKTVGQTRTELQFSSNWTDAEKKQVESIWTRMPLQVRSLAPLYITKETHFVGRLLHSLPFLDNSSVLIPVPQFKNQEKSFEKAVIEALFRELDYRLEFSRSKEWRDISGWSGPLPFDSFLPKWFSPENQDRRAYASYKGLDSPTDDFSSFAFLYFTDTPDARGEDSIKCRTPRKYRFFKRHFGERDKSFEQMLGTCQPISQGFLSDIEFIHPLTHKPLDLGPIDSDSVTGFEILYATPGVGEMAEVAGHLLLRIKLKNNPHATKSGIENPYDLVVSFLADTGNQNLTTPNPQPQCKNPGGFFDIRDTHTDFDPLASTLQALKGLSGGFLTTFDRSTLYATVYNYTVLQDRNLLRFELQLNKDQKKSLLDRLFVAKKNYKSKYFFFDRNCASILVKMIAEGIGELEIQEFDPVVSPPNTLIAYMHRKALIKPIFPSFYGYRKEAQIAQNLIRDELAAIEKQNSISLTDKEKIFSKNESTRLKAIKELFHLRHQNPAIGANLVKISRLIQISEKLYLERDDLCTPFTSQVIAQTRQFLLITEAHTPAQRLDHTIQIAHIPSEAEVLEKGSKHTKHYSIQFGYRQKTAGDFTFVGLALHSQIMGDYSSHAMQRTSEVVLGHLQGELNGSSITSSKFTLLKIRKFRDELDRAPTIFQTSRTFGIGLGLLNYTRNNDLSEMNWATGELLFSLYSGRMNDNHLYFVTGLNLKSLDEAEQKKNGVGLTVGLHGLWTLDQTRKWQLRVGLEYETIRYKESYKYDYEGRIYLSHRVHDSEENELLVFTEFNITKSMSEVFQLGLEINNW